ncbi:hypothetical protein NDU88_003105 [Pleurodeles waltl]|uniref:Uncharacterized protein n=1 Tax=Pleurodeles waltl TaxID=8319 RepID=A0AAV7QC09_PLEWA|nr:hypothetical protein NDU88_003105 [Pleurodeles waltl]
MDWDGLLARPGTLEQQDVSPTPTGSPTLADILQAITATRNALETKIDTLVAEYGLLKDDHRCLAERVTMMEREVTDIPAAMTGAQAQLTELENKGQGANDPAELQHGQNAAQVTDAMLRLGYP